MADPIVGATTQILLEKALSLATDRIGLAFGFKDELENLRESMVMIRAFLVDADSRQNHDTAVQLWLKRLEGVAFDADHALDELHYETLRRRVVKYENQQLKQSKVCFFFSFSHTKIAFRWRMASKVRDINMKLNKINQKANDLGLNIRHQIHAPLSSTALPAATGATASRQTDSIPVPNVVGRADKESEIVNMLLSPSEKVLSVIPITGAGGLGKTTLAKSVYNNPKLAGHFGQKIWVCMAKEQINIMELFKLILVQLIEEEVKVDDRNVTVKKIGDKLQSKKYFLVLDDVWDHEQGLWNDFFSTLMGLNEAKGSWCLVTTRSELVANAVARPLKMKGGPHFLGKLSDNECWSILKEMVVAGDEVPTELEAIKEQILKKCDGLPLAAKLIGGLLLNNETEEWQSIVTGSLLNEDQDQNQDQINQILTVSFDHLPPSVKKCFAYCAIFPQDTLLEEDELIQHWIAKSFVLPYQENEGMEETGSVYWRILLQNSLLEKTEDKWRRTYYKMHDLVHDFAKSILKPESSNQDRYLALSSSEALTENTKMTMPASIHTLFLHLESGTSADMFLADMLSRFECLHVLKLSGDDVKFLPSSIGKLRQLQLLDISSSRIKSLPESLCKLYHLQTLTMRDGALERGFPKRMSNLVSLRHLNYYPGRDVEFKMPAQIGQLIRLQNLRFFNVSQEKGCGIEELGTLKYLKGSLEIINLGLAKGKEAANQAKLFEKPNLSHLEFRWEKNEDRKSDNCDEDVLEGLHPHQNLQELEIHYFMGNKFPQWFMNLSKLVKLQIVNCQRCSELPALQQLPSLKYLFLFGLDNIQFVGDEFDGITNEEEEEGRRGGPRSSTRRRKFFPALEELHVENMKNFVGWKDVDRSTISETELAVFPMLRNFSIIDCPQLTQLTTLPCLCKILVVENCPKLTSIRMGNGTSLEHLTLDHCDNLRELPEGLFGSSLRRLSIFHCARLISLGVNGQKFPLPCLEELTIMSCHELITLPCLSKILKVRVCPNLTGIRMGNGTSLERLTLDGCDNLRELPEGMFQSSLQELDILCCPRLISLGVNGQKCPLPYLKKFNISSCNELTTIPDKMFESCTSLQRLSVWGCPNLEPFSLNLQETPSLEEFILIDCPKLIPQMFKGFASATHLRKLWIGPFSPDDSSIDDFDWSGLICAPALRELLLQGLPHMDSLPRQLQCLTTLTSLHLSSFGGIEVLPDWIGDLVSLEQLWLFDCKKLRSLPSDTAMRRLTKLTRLDVDRCPLLEEEISSDRASSESEEEEVNDDEQAHRDGKQKSIDSVQTSASRCFPLLPKKKSSGDEHELEGSMETNIGEEAVKASSASGSKQESNDGACCFPLLLKKKSLGEP